MPAGMLAVRGSSPLTRGKRAPDPHPQRGQRLIPAHAGKTSLRRSAATSSGAHPRSRGENERGRSMVSAQSGSSPLTRGKPAGRRHPRRAAPAHPRSRGENSPNQGYEAKVSGSSPLTRGKRGRCFDLFPRRGLIPAHAGKTGTRGVGRASCGAHPRSRGENPGREGEVPPFAGSSPLTRGKPGRRQASVIRAGLIPAHAGKTTTPLPRSRSWWAHPRSRGENPGREGEVPPFAGSSPLTRGKLSDALEHLAVCGLIPAHAGKTSRRSRARRPCRAHPRSRGENLSGEAAPTWTCGSSPLTRGKPTRRRLQHTRRWLIPAHAGKTVPA